MLAVENLRKWMLECWCGETARWEMRKLLCYNWWA